MKTKDIVPTPIRSDSLPAIPDVRRIPEFIEFVQWNALPTWYREPKTQKGFAEQIGVSQDTLTDWKKHSEFWPLVWHFLREWMKEQTPNVIGGLYEKIVSAKGSASDVQLFLNLVNGKPKSSKKKN